MVAIVEEQNLAYAVDVMRRYSVSTPVYSRLTYKGKTYFVFEKAPAAALMLIQLEKGVKIDGIN